MILQDFGRRLELIRISRALTQDAMAKKLGVSKRSYCAYEAGETAPNAKFLAELAGLGVDITYILTGMKAATHTALSAMKAGTAAGMAVEAITGNRDDALSVQEAVVMQYTGNMLTDDESTLLDNYRQSSPESQSAILAASAAFAQSSIKEK